MPAVPQAQSTGRGRSKGGEGRYLEQVQAGPNQRYVVYGVFEAGVWYTRLMNRDFICTPYRFRKTDDLVDAYITCNRSRDMAIHFAVDGYKERVKIRLHCWGKPLKTAVTVYWMMLAR